jgi:hypothetical protein
VKSTGERSRCEATSATSLPSMLAISLDVSTVRWSTPRPLRPCWQNRGLRRWR